MNPVFVADWPHLEVQWSKWVPCLYKNTMKIRTKNYNLTCLLQYFQTPNAIFTQGVISEATWSTDLWNIHSILICLRMLLGRSASFALQHLKWIIHFRIYTPVSSHLGLEKRPTLNWSSFHFSILLLFFLASARIGQLSSSKYENVSLGTSWTSARTLFGGSDPYWSLNES